MSIFQTVTELFVKFGLEGVMGYFRPVSGYNKGKASEYKERRWFSEKKIADKLPKKSQNVG